MRGIKFTMLSQEIYEEKIPFLKVPSQIKLQYAIMWAGLLGYLDAKEQEPDFTYEDVQEWVDKMKADKRIEDFDKVNFAFQESVAFRNRFQEIEDRANKIRAFAENEIETIKKKVTSILNGSQSISSPSAASA